MTMISNSKPNVRVKTRLAFKKASSDSLRNFFQGVCLNVKMTVLLAEETSANIKIKVKSTLARCPMVSVYKFRPEKPGSY
jgi:hypothetical protein